MTRENAISFLKENHMSVTDARMARLTGVATIICRTCFNDKPHRAFYKDASAKTGYQSSCKQCSNEAKMENAPEPGWGCEVEQTNEAKSIHRIGAYGDQRYDNVKFKPKRITGKVPHTFAG